ncbi:MAG: hypothetical protein AAFQ65_13545 [Myxococcota bacterium]
MDSLNVDHPKYSSRFYRESGVAPLGGIVLALVAGLGAALVLAPIYSALTFINPFVYINVLATLGLGFGLTVAVQAGANWGSIRNYKVVVLVGVLSALMAEYASWVTFIFMLTERGTIILDPLAIVEVLPLIAQEGYYTLRSAPVSGTILWILWGVEASIVFGFTILGAWGVSSVYCEESGGWTQEESDVVRVHPTDDGFIQGLLDEKYEVLSERAEVLPPTSLEALRIDLFRPRLRTAKHYLSLVRLSPKETKDGVEAEEEVVLKHLIVPAHVADQVQALGAKASASTSSAPT